MTERRDDKWVDGRRTHISRVVPHDISKKCEHAGLWFDKYLVWQLNKGAALSQDETSPYKDLIDAVVAIVEPAEYQAFFKRWQAQIETMHVAIDGCEYRVLTKPAQVQGRLAIGLGDESVIETAVMLHRTYGVPYIPGSALKGLAAAYAHRMLEGDTWRKAIYTEGRLVKKAGEAHTAMFGTTSSAGYVAFFDALYVPGSGHQDKPLWPDVITVHHKDYYTGGTPKPPADWDSPTPVPFLTATGTYLIALGGPFAWVKLAFDLLGRALHEMGIGAKTSSGYGRMVFVAQPVMDSTAPMIRQAAPPKTGGQPPVESPRRTLEAADQPGSAPPGPEMPMVGAVFTGLVLERDERAVIVEVPGFSDERAIGLLRVEPDTPKWTPGKDRARVEVIGVRQQGKRTILDLKRGPKAEKKG